VVGVGSSTFFVVDLFNDQKITKAMIKPILVQKRAVSDRYACLLFASSDAGCVQRSINRLAKSTFPNSRPIGGMMIPSTSDVTIFPTRHDDYCPVNQLHFRATIAKLFQHESFSFWSAAFLWHFHLNPPYSVWHCVPWFSMRRFDGARPPHGGQVAF
jgi:hypothetical protein